MNAVIAAGMFGIDLPLAQAVPTPIAISATAVNFGAVVVGTTATRAVTLTNTHVIDPFGPINMFGGAPPTAEFNASQNCQGRTLPPGGSCTISYTFTPSSTGTFNDSSNFTVSATANQADGENFVVTLTGTGVNPTTASPLAHNFGNVTVGSTKSANTVITNTGTQPFGPINMFGGAPPTAEFDASQNCQGVTLPPGGSCTIFYTFTPSGGGKFNDSSNFTISATANQADGKNFVVTLTGTGVNPITASPLTHNFGNVTIGSTKSANTVITNTGTQPFGPINVFGGAPPTAEFNASQNCQGVTLPPGGSCTIFYTFTPSASGTFNDTSTFTISATASQAAGVNFSVRLTGCGIQAGQSCPVAATTSTTVTCTPNPASAGQAVTCTATVTASGGTTPSGSVTFTADGNAVANDSLDGAGRARFTTGSLAPGVHAIFAIYSPNTQNFLSSTSAPFLLSIGAIQAQTAVEYFHSGFGFYFVTSFASEISVLDGGAFGGVWQRTGQTFPVWANQDAGTSPVCRFFSTSFAPRSSHFYTPFTAECDAVKSNPDWQFEAIAFFLKIPDNTGACPAGSAPLHRLYNNGMGGAPNHRYTTSSSVAAQMQALGWVPEGFGSAGVLACVPSP